MVVTVVVRCELHRITLLYTVADGGNPHRKHHLSESSDDIINERAQFAYVCFRGARAAG